MASATAVVPQRSRGARFQRGIQPYAYLIPAFLVMAVITFYPLFFQVWMSFHDFGQINFRVRNPVPAEFIGLENYVRIATSKLQIPNFEFLRLVLFNLWWAFSNVVVHIIIGVLVAVIIAKNASGNGIQEIGSSGWRSQLRWNAGLSAEIPTMPPSAWRPWFTAPKSGSNMFRHTVATMIGGMTTGRMNRAR